MSLNIIDVVILLLLLAGAVIGFKRGIIKSIVMFVGTIVVLIAAWYLKNPLSHLLYTYLPFFKVSGDYAGVAVMNILIYESIAFIIAYIILASLYRIVINVSGVIEKILNATIILGIPSKILGAIFGFIEMYVILFFMIFVFSQFTFSEDLISKSKYSNWMMNNTPVLSNMTGSVNNAITDLNSLKREFLNNVDKEEYNRRALEILLKYDVINSDTAQELLNNGKIDGKGIQDLINEYKKKNT